MQANNQRLTTGISELHERASAIALLLLDVDGILTDGRLYFSNSGASHTQPAHAILHTPCLIKRRPPIPFQYTT